MPTGAGARSLCRGFVRLSVPKMAYRSLPDRNRHGACIVMLSGALRCDKLQRHTTWGHHQEGGASEATLVNKVSDNVMDDEQQIDAAGLAALDRFSNERGLPEQFGTVFLQWYAGVTAALAKRAGTSESPLLVGLSGCQGSGKSTLVDAMARSIGGRPRCRNHRAIARRFLSH